MTALEIVADLKVALVFFLDFLPSPKVPKGKDKKSTLGLDISEGTSAAKQVTGDSQKSDGMGSHTSE